MRVRSWSNPPFPSLDKALRFFHLDLVKPNLKSIAHHFTHRCKLPLCWDEPLVTSNNPPTANLLGRTGTTEVSSLSPMMISATLLLPYH
jgi:hypothetical protein